MRALLLLILLALLAGCQDGPGPARGPTYRDHNGGMCSPYASNCW